MPNLSTGYSQQLTKLGLTEHEALLYQYLLTKGPQTSKDLASELNVLPNALYRLLDRLKKKGLITQSGKYPSLYRAIQPSLAFDSFIKKEVHELESLKEQVIAQFFITHSDQTKIELIKDLKSFFAAYTDLLQKSEQEVLIISPGEPLPNELLLVHQEVLSRNLVIKMVSHKVDSTNKEYINRLKRMGFAIRNFPDWGFNLLVFDKKMAILLINDTSNSEEKIGFMIFSTGLGKALADYFTSIWEKSEPV